LLHGRSGFFYLKEALIFLLRLATGNINGFITANFKGFAQLLAGAFTARAKRSLGLPGCFSPGFLASLTEVRGKLFQAIDGVQVKLLR